MKQFPFRDVCKLALLLSFVAAMATAKAADKERPNIVFILVDDMRWDSLSCVGHPFVKTPNIDRIAKEGAIFKNFFVSIPLCSPSRASFLTSLYAHTHGVIDNRDHSALTHKLVTWPRLLHDAGYETAFIGKWHMGLDDSPRPGFDRWVSFKGQGVYQNPVLNIDGNEQKMEGYITDLLNTNALEFLKKEHKKPFVLYLSHKAVHGPFTPAERHKNLYANDPIPHAPSLMDDLKGKPVLTRPVDNKKVKKTKAFSDEDEPQHKSPDRLIRQQLRALMAIEDGVGEILATLEQTKQLDNTIIMFSSDNGYFWGEHGLGDKRWAYEEAIRDPFLMRYPKLIKPGSTFEQMVLNIDVAPTMLDVAGVPIPKTFQGRSLLPLLKGDKQWRHAALFEYFQEKMYPQTPTWQAVRTDDWKYIHYMELDGMDELYNIKKDPYEMNNLINDASAQAKLKDLKTELQAKLTETK